MGLMQRRKGRSYEQAIANELRRWFPSADVRRSSQADRAVQSDVYFLDGATLLKRIWFECEDARKPNPSKKLAQAELDIDHAWCHGMRRPDDRLPIVVWHRLRERESYVTTRLWVLDAIRDGEGGWGRAREYDAEVTLGLGEFLEIVEGAVAHATKEAA